MTSYTLVRSQRKTTAIYITRDAAIEVRAPLKRSKADIDRFVASKEQWIRSHLEKASARAAARSAFTLDYGREITLFGQEYPIAAGNGRGVSFDGASVFVPHGLGSYDIMRAVIRLYRSVAEAKLNERAAYFAALVGVQPTAMKITGAKTRWGSCSGKNRINFSWRLMMADDDAIDYLLVHELAHIKEHNHSPRFWAIVESILPDYKARKKKLKLLQKKLAVENWGE